MMFVKGMKKEEKSLWLELLQFFVIGMDTILVTVYGLATAPAIVFAIVGAVGTFVGIMLVIWMLVTCLEEYENQA